MSAANEKLAAAHAEVKAEIARTDTKTALLLAFVGAVLAGTWSVARDLPFTWPSAVVGGLGITVLLCAAGLLLWAVRPSVKGRHGFPLWATLTADEITAIVNATDTAGSVAALSRLALAKFRCLRRAVDLTLTGCGLLALAALLALGGAA